ncbi:MAG: hypothetical protein AB3N23_18205 [Paracoccaceae bacterium]
MEAWVIIALIGASALGTGLLFLAIRNNADQQAKYAAFAEAQGWQFHYGPSKDHPDDAECFSDPSDDWTLRIVFISTGVTDGSATRYVEWHTPQGALPDGVAVLGIVLPPQSVAMLQSGGMIAQQILKVALKATTHALGNTSFKLNLDEATAGDPGGIVLSSDGHAREMDGLRKNADLARYRETCKEAEVPVIIRDKKGMTLRRPGKAKKMDDLVALVELGKSLRRDV